MIMEHISGEHSLDPNLLEELLACGKSVKFTVTGLSMGRTIRSGDSIIVAPRSHSSPWNGAIILFRTPCDNLRVHRIIGMKSVEGKLYYQTKGDSQDRGDIPVPSDEILGVVTTIEREHGFRFRKQRRLSSRLGRWETRLEAVRERLITRFRQKR